MAAVPNLFGAGAKVNLEDMRAAHAREARDGVRMISPIEYAALTNLPVNEMAKILRANRHQASAFTAQYGQYGEAVVDYSRGQSLHGVCSWNPIGGDVKSGQKVGRDLVLAQFARCADPETLGKYVQLQLHGAADVHVNRLVAASGVTEHRDFEGRTALMFAASNSAVATKVMLNDFGADAKAVDVDGRNAVAFAVLYQPKDAAGKFDENGFSEHLGGILDANASPWVRDKSGRNQFALAEGMLRQAALRDPSIEVEEQLLRAAKVAMVRDTSRQANFMLTDGKQDISEVSDRQRKAVMAHAEDRVGNEMQKMSRADQLQFVKQADLGDQRPSIGVQVDRWIQSRDTGPTAGPRGLKR